MSLLAARSTASLDQPQSTRLRNVDVVDVVIVIDDTDDTTDAGAAATEVVTTPMTMTTITTMTTMRVTMAPALQCYLDLQQRTAEEMLRREPAEEQTRSHVERAGIAPLALAQLPGSAARRG